MTDRRLTRADVSAWVIKANPAFWDVDTAWANDVEITTWRLGTTYRNDLIEPGDAVYLWATTNRETGEEPSICGAGIAAGPPELRKGDGDLWLDETERDKALPYLPISGWVWFEPVYPARLPAGDPLTACEPVRSPQLVAPNHLTTLEHDQLRTLRQRFVISGLFDDPEVALVVHGEGPYSAIHHAGDVLEERGWPREEQTIDYGPAGVIATVTVTQEDGEELVVGIADAPPL